MADEPKVDFPGCGGYIVFGPERFDARLDFFLCKKHGVITPLRFAPDWWTTDDGCPVPNHEEDGMCGRDITPVFFDSFLNAAQALRRVHEAAQAWREDESFQGDGDRRFESDADFLDHIVEVCKEVFDV